MVERGGSDLHLSVGQCPMMRLHGRMIKMDYPVLTKEDAKKVIGKILSPEQLEKFYDNLDIDLRYAIEGCARFRVNVFSQTRGEAIVFRAIPHNIPSVSDLNLPKAVVDFCSLPNGLILVTGPTGSGKSTTLAAMLNYINENSEQHIVSIEDPVEFVHQNKLSLINQRELGGNTKSFSNALRAVLRQDPDVILIGEMRDLETIRLALTAAETGHLVLATLHTSSAAKSINRLIDVFPGTEKELIRTMLSDSLQGVIAQRLIPSTQGGRVAAIEIMIATPAVRNLIRENQISQLVSVIQTGKHLGMQTMEQHVRQLVEEGLVNPEELSRFSVDKENH